MSIDVGEFAKSFRAHYGSGAAALRALGIKTARKRGGVVVFDEAEPETLNGFLKRSGLTRDQIAEFHRLCREGAKDEEEAEEENDGFDPLDDAVNKVLAGIAKLEPGDATSCNEALEHILSQTRNGATDAIPSRGRNGLPRNALGGGGAMDEDRARRAAQHRHTQACDITLGTDSAYGLAIDGVRFPGERRKPRSGAEKLPDTSHIKVGAI
jgi:hypothetical protein